MRDIRNIMYLCLYCCSVFCFFFFAQSSSFSCSRFFRKFSFQFLYSNKRMISSSVQKNVADGFVTGVVAGLAAVGIRCSLVF